MEKITKLPYKFIKNYMNLIKYSENKKSNIKRRRKKGIPQLNNIPNINNKIKKCYELLLF